MPAINESNEILRNDLSELRRKQIKETQHVQKHLRSLEARLSEADMVRAKCRELATQLLDISNGTNQATSSFFHSNRNFRTETRDEVSDDNSVGTIAEKDMILAVEQFAMDDTVGGNRRIGRRRDGGGSSVRSVVEAAREQVHRHEYQHSVPRDRGTKLRKAREDMIERENQSHAHLEDSSCSTPNEYSRF